MTITGTQVRQQYEGDGATTLYSFGMEITRDSDISVSWLDINQVEDFLIQDTDYTIIRTFDALGKSTGGSIQLLSSVPVLEADEFLTILARGLPTQDEDLSSFGAFNARAVEDALDRLTILQKYFINDMDQGRIIRLKDSAVVTEDHAMYAGGRRVGGAADATANDDLATLQQVSALVTAAEITPGTISGLTAFGADFLTAADGDSGMTKLGITSFWRSIVDKASLALSLPAMGFSTLLETILKRTLADDVLGDLGVTTLMKALLKDATTADARATLEVTSGTSIKNKLINGDFQVFQRGPIGTGLYAGQNSESEKFANWSVDAWQATTSTPGGATVISQEQMPLTGLPDGASGAIECTQLRADIQWGMFNRLIDSEALPLQGSDVSYSIAVQAPDTMNDFRVWLMYSTGTDNPNPVTTWNAIDADPTWNSPSWDVVPGSEIAIVGTAAWQTFSVDGLTLPSSFTHLGFMFMTRSAAMPVNDRVRMTAAQLLENPTLLDFRSLTFEEEYRRARLLYQKTTPYGIPLMDDSILEFGSPNGVYGALMIDGSVRSSTMFLSPHMINFNSSTIKRRAPAGVGTGGDDFNSLAGAALVTNIDESTPPSVGGGGKVSFYTTTSGSAGTRYFLHVGVHYKEV